MNSILDNLHLESIDDDDDNLNDQLIRIIDEYINTEDTNKVFLYKKDYTEFEFGERIFENNENFSEFLEGIKDEIKLESNNILDKKIFDNKYWIEKYIYIGEGRDPITTVLFFTNGITSFVVKNEGKKILDDFISEYLINKDGNKEKLNDILLI